MANLALRKKLTKINKDNKKVLEKKIKYNKRCFNIICSGVLDEKYFCDICMTNYCKTCERIEENNHSCKEEDLQSLKYIQSSVKCPTCYFPIERIYGCDHMRCPGCKTHFNYATGVKMEGPQMS